MTRQPVPVALLDPRAMKRLYRVLLALTIVLCTTATHASESPKEQITRGNSTFAVELYQRLAASTDGNVFFSPFSISAAFAIAFIGAGGETADEMRTTLRFPDTDTITHRGMQEISHEIRARSESDSTEIRIANALWVEETIELQKRFLTHSERFYGPVVQPADFIGQPGTERTRINDWVEEQTNNRIKDLLPEGSITSLTRIVIANAIYFLATWAHQFDEAMTKDAPFHRADGSSIDSPFMNQTQHFGYMERPQFRAVRLPYFNEALGMVILLPREAGGLGAIETNLDPDTVITWLDTGFENGKRLNLYLPRFKMKYSTTLSKFLKEMGMLKPFEPMADFSGMSAGLYITEAFHKAFIAVSESGTEAAAATAIVFGTTSAPPPPQEFRVDRPFLFFIYDRVAKTILFMGRVMDPTGK